MVDAREKKVEHKKRNPGRRRSVRENFGAPGRIRTHDPLVRSQVLYPTELLARYQNRRSRILRELFEKSKTPRKKNLLLRFFAGERHAADRTRRLIQASRLWQRYCRPSGAFPFDERPARAKAARRWRRRGQCRGVARHRADRREVRPKKGRPRVAQGS